MNDDIEQLLGRLNPTGVEAELRSRVLAAVESELEPSESRSKSATRCNHPGGHAFVCIHCGSEPRRASFVGRWAWPAAAAAMTCAAAVLLIALVTSGPKETAIAKGSPAPSGIAAAPNPTQPSAAPLPSAQNALASTDEEQHPLDGFGRGRRGAAPQRPDGWRILSTADTDLRDVIFGGRAPSAAVAESHGAEGNGSVSPHILSESDVLAGAAELLQTKTSLLSGSRL